MVLFGVGCGLVVAGGVENELAEQLAGVFVDDADVAVLDQEQDVGSGVGSADTDVMEPALVAQVDNAGGVDAVTADSGVGRCGRRAGAGGGFWAGEVGRGGGASVEGAVRAPVVVGEGVGVEQGLEAGNGRGLDRLRR